MTALSRELIVAAKARADAALHFDGHPDDWDDVAYGSVRDVPVMADALLRVLDLHTSELWIDADQFGHDRVRGVYCDECRQSYPCATVQAVTGDDERSTT